MPSEHYGKCALKSRNVLEAKALNDTRSVN